MPDPDPASNPLDSALQLALQDREGSGLLRRRRVVRALDAAHVEIDGVRLVHFSSNNYLGLTHHPAVVEACADGARGHGAGAAASALISGHTPAHGSAEAALAAWKGTEDARLLPSGYQANHAAIQTIAGSAEAAGRSVRFLLDKLAHASLIDATRSTGQRFRVFPHNDLAKLEGLLSDAAPGEIQVVVTESIFSMDGDAAPLADLATLKQKYGFTLLLDEAHASGVYGPGGAGYAAELGLTNSVDIFIVTLSKAMGLAGGAICASRRFCDGVTNFGRAYIYSTAMPPAQAAGCAAALRVMRDEPQRQQRVRDLARRVRASLGNSGVIFPPGPDDSPIIPVTFGTERVASDAAKRLETHGILVLPVRPPTVSRGSSRLRVTVSSEHSDEEVAQLLSRLTGLVAP